MAGNTLYIHSQLEIDRSVQTHLYPLLVRMLVLHKIQLTFRVDGSACKWKQRITVFLVFVRHYPLKFTAARYLADTWLREAIFMEDSLEEMHSSILPHNLKIYFRIKGDHQKMPNWTLSHWTQHNCFSLSCVLAIVIKQSVMAHWRYFLLLHIVILPK